VPRSIVEVALRVDMQERTTMCGVSELQWATISADKIAFVAHGQDFKIIIGFLLLCRDSIMSFNVAPIALFKEQFFSKSQA